VTEPNIPDGGRRASDSSIAVAIPAYNEASGIGEFLLEIDRALAQTTRLRFVVVNDASTDQTLTALEGMRQRLRGELEIFSNPTNRGHGPSLMEAYRRALAGTPDFVLQVDGDGQFHGSDLRRVLVLLADGSRAVGGVRRFRQDPWFRMHMTRLVRRYVERIFAVRARDPNCPLRGYEAALLRKLLPMLPPACLVPNLYLTIVAFRRGVPLLEVDVSHRVRRGESAEGVTWRRAAWSPVPLRLVRFSILALSESIRFHSRLSASAPASEVEGGSPLGPR